MSKFIDLSEKIDSTPPSLKDKELRQRDSITHAEGKKEAISSGQWVYVTHNDPPRTGLLYAPHTGTSLSLSSYNAETATALGQVLLALNAIVRIV